MSSISSNSQAARGVPRVALVRFLGPRYWLVWLALGFVRFVNLWPLRIQVVVGKLLGSLAHLLSRRDRRTAGINVALCLPELSEQDRQRMLAGTALEFLGLDRASNGMQSKSKKKRSGSPTR